jgi:hypothetical protein
MCLLEMKFLENFMSYISLGYRYTWLEARGLNHVVRDSEEFKTLLDTLLWVDKDAFWLILSTIKDPFCDFAFKCL